MKKFLLLVVLLVAAVGFGQTQTIFSNLDEQPWQTCGACGNSKGNTLLAAYSAVPTSVGSLDGKATLFTIKGIPGKYVNAYWYHKFAGSKYNPLWSAFTQYDLSFFEFAAGYQQLEFEIQPVIGGYLYNGGVQCDQHSHLWRVFEKTAVDHGMWVATTVACNLSPGEWHFIEAKYHRANTEMYFDSLTVDQTTYPLGIHFLAVADATNDYLSSAFQLDDPSSGIQYSVVVDRMQLTAE